MHQLALVCPSYPCVTLPHIPTSLYLNAGPRRRFHGHPVLVEIRHGRPVQLLQVLLQGLVLSGHKKKKETRLNARCHEDFS